MDRWTRLLIVALVTVGVGFGSACSEEAGLEPRDTNEAKPAEPAAGTGGQVEGTSGPAYPDLDRDIDSFLDGYIEMDERFSDNDLDFDVENGVVSVTGSVDSPEEREMLLERLRDVPGVRNVNARELTLRNGRPANGRKSSGKTPERKR